MSSTHLADLGGLSEALVALVEKTKSGVVAVRSAGHRVVSGVSLPDNLIAVASHAIRREDRVPVQAADGSQGTATLLGRDPGVDLAVLKADGLTLSPLAVADASMLKPGMLAAIIGLTIDVGPSVSLGLLAAVGAARRTWRGGTLDHFLRLDADIYPSQSGAAVVNTEGQLIGLATPALSRHSAMAIPMATIQRIARELSEQGRIRHGYLGVGVQPVAVRRNTPEAQQGTGLILLSVEPDSPAENAGLLLGDVLLTLSGNAMADVDDLHGALRGEIVGKTVKAVVLRGGATVEVEITISERGKKS